MVELFVLLILLIIVKNFGKFVVEFLVKVCWWGIWLYVSMGVGDFFKFVVGIVDIVIWGVKLFFVFL